MAEQYAVPPLEVMSEATACLNAGMKPEELLQILAVIRKALSEGNNRFNISWSKETDEKPEAPN